MRTEPLLQPAICRGDLVSPQDERALARLPEGSTQLDDHRVRLARLHEATVGLQSHLQVVAFNILAILVYVCAL